MYNRLLRCIIFFIKSDFLSIYRSLEICRGWWWVSYEIKVEVVADQDSNLITQFEFLIASKKISVGMSMKAHMRVDRVQLDTRYIYYSVVLSMSKPSFDE